MGKHDVSSVLYDSAKNVIRITVVGEVDGPQASRLIDKIKQLTAELRADKRPVLLLADLKRTGKIDSDAKRAAKEFFKNAKYDRIAIFGASKENIQILGLLVKTIARVLRIKFFTAEASALRWLSLGRISLKTKARIWLATAVGMALLAVAWQQYIAPYLLRLPADFSYQASVISHDNFYDERAASYSGVTTSDTKFGFTTAGQRGGVLDIKNLFDVRTTTGEKIFSVERTYGIDRITRQHTPGNGDRDRTGYLFAPPRLNRQNFTYWHINYDEPANMEFEDEEGVLGLTTYRYTANYHADQTKNLSNLPGVGVTRGVNLDINLQLWIEPETGYLVKYEDHTTAYFYDLATGQRQNPWNQFSNSYSFDSIAEQVKLADSARRRSVFVGTSIPILLAIIAIGLVARAAITSWRGSDRVWPKSTVPRACAAVAAAVAALVIAGWVTNTTLLTRIHPTFSAMHILTATGFIVIAVALWVSTTLRLTTLKKMTVQLLAGLVFIGAALLLCRQFFGLDIGADALLRIFGLPSITGISPVTAICFMTLSVVLILCMQTASKLVNLTAQALLCLVLALAAFAIAGYAFELQYLYSIPWFRAMAIHTAVLFIVLVAGIFASQPTWRITTLIRSASRSLMLALGVLILLLVLTGFSWQQSIINTNKQADIQFQGDANSLQTSIDNELQGYIKALRGAQSLLAASQDVDRGEWKAYVDGLRLAQNYPGMQGMGYIQQVSPVDRAAHISKVRKESGFSTYTIYPDAVRDNYDPVVFIEPLNERNRRAVGYDISSEPVRREALERARDTGEAAMSGHVTLVQETGVDQQPGLLIFLPIYKHDAPIATIEQRRAALVGYVYTPIRVTDFMRATVGQQTHGLNIGVFDTKTPDALTLAERLYVVNTQYGIENQAYRPKFVRIEPLPVAGHTLTMRYSSLPNYDAGAAQTIPALILFGGVVLSFVLAIFTFVLSNSRIRAVKLADVMTVDLRNERAAAVATQQKVEAILSSIGDGVFALDNSGNIVLFNPAAEAITRRPAAEMLHQPFGKALYFYDEKTGQPANDFIATAMSGRRAEMAANTSLKRKDGVSVPVADSATPILNAQGDIDGAVVVFRDVTRERQLEHMKDEFLSVASHELRTPMGAIRANVSMILSGDYGKINKALVEPLTDMKASTIRLVELVNDLLNVARIEAGRMRFTLGNFELREALRSTVASLAPLGQERGLQITFAKGKDVAVQADIDKVKQVLTNLIGNSLKFTSKGSITVAADLQDGQVEVTVVDTGIGISPADQQKLFGKFEQITSAQEGKPAGTGLGLYISREIIRKMGGELWIKASAPGKGSTFAFTLPLAGTLVAQKVKKVLEREASLHPDQKVST